ncbi:MAG: hypothetical protein WB782_07020 [Thermoplasmata archaeon]
MATKMNFVRNGLLIGLTIALLSMIVISGSATLTTSARFDSLIDLTHDSELSVKTTATSGASVLDSCELAAAQSSVYDPADGYVYVASDGPISIVKPPCTVIGSLTPTYGAFALAYDPLTKEVVTTAAAFSEANFAYVLAGTSLVATVKLGPSLNCPISAAWDPAISAILIGNEGCGPGGVSVLYLALVNGVTHAAVIEDAFDSGSADTSLLVADGYIFSAGANVSVFNDRTFAFVGQFAVSQFTRDGAFNHLAWDPLNDTVVLGITEAPSVASVLFLNASGILARHFDFQQFKTVGILAGGVGGAAYSPATQSVYLSAADGNDIWELSKSGDLTHVYLGKIVAPEGLAYDPTSHEMYVCGENSNMLYVIR